MRFISSSQNHYLNTKLGCIIADSLLYGTIQPVLILTNLLLLQQIELYRTYWRVFIATTSFLPVTKVIFYYALKFKVVDRFRHKKKGPKCRIVTLISLSKSTSDQNDANEAISSPDLPCQHFVGEGRTFVREEEHGLDRNDEE